MDFPAQVNRQSWKLLNLKCGLVQSDFTGQSPAQNMECEQSLRHGSLGQVPRVTVEVSYSRSPSKLAVDMCGPETYTPG